jgi:glutamate/aspartate transport system permease protein
VPRTEEEAIMDYKWNWALLIEEPYLGWLLDGLTWTISVALVAWLIGVTVGTLFGILRTLGGVGGALGAAFVAVFRNTPLLVQLFVWYFVIPELLPSSMGNWLKRDLPNPEFWTASVAVGLFAAARITEQVRAAIGSVRVGLKQAVASYGFSTTEGYRHVILPIALRFVLPPLTSETLNTVKNSSLALTIGLLELTGASRQIESYTFHGFEAFAVATLIYVCLSGLVIFAMQRMESYLAIPGLMGGK